MNIATCDSPCASLPKTATQAVPALRAVGLDAVAMQPHHYIVDDGLESVDPVLQ